MDILLQKCSHGVKSSLHGWCVSCGAITKAIYSSVAFEACLPGVHVIIHERLRKCMNCDFTLNKVMNFIFN